MDEERFRIILREEILSAFRDVGLADDDAHNDVKDLRSLIVAYRSAQKTIFKTVLTFFTLGDVAMTDEMRTYRQALRDVPAQAGFPRTIEWPTAPMAQ